MTHRTAYVTKTDTWNVFSTRTNATPTFLDETFMDLLELMKQTETRHLLQLQLQWRPRLFHAWDM